MPRLNQIVAVEKGTKTRAQRDLTDTHHALQKQVLLSGISRSYTPDAEDGEQFPSETSRVQVRTKELIKRTEQVLAELFDITATKDEANCSARADVVVDGKVLLKQVPVTTLLFMEKQLVDLHTFVKKLPVLDPAESWKFDPSQDCYATEPSFSAKTRKTPRAFVKAPATDKHPAQVDTYTEEVKIGQWKVVKYSGALPQKEVNDILEKVERLQKAVKFAREEANNTEVTTKSIAKELFGFVFGTTN